MFKIFSTYICWRNIQNATLEASGAVRTLYVSLGVRGLTSVFRTNYILVSYPLSTRTFPFISVEMFKIKILILSLKIVKGKQIFFFSNIRAPTPKYNMKASATREPTDVKRHRIKLFFWATWQPGFVQFWKKIYILAQVPDLWAIKFEGTIFLRKFRIQLPSEMASHTRKKTES